MSLGGSGYCFFPGNSNVPGVAFHVRLQWLLFFTGKFGHSGEEKQHGGAESTNSPRENGISGANVFLLCPGMPHFPEHLQ